MFLGSKVWLVLYFETIANSVGAILYNLSCWNSLSDQNTLSKIIKLTSHVWMQWRWLLAASLQEHTSCRLCASYERVASLQFLATEHHHLVYGLYTHTLQELQKSVWSIVLYKPKSKLLYDWRSVSMSWCRASLWGPWPDLLDSHWREIALMLWTCISYGSGRNVYIIVCNLLAYGLVNSTEDLNMCGTADVKSVCHLDRSSRWFIVGHQIISLTWAHLMVKTESCSADTEKRRIL
jgi:hypothetical protein